MTEYRTVEGELGAVNALTNLTTFGSETAVGPIPVPSGASRISEIWVGVGTTLDTSGDQGVILLRLSGKGMVQGDQDFVIHGAGVITVTIAGGPQNDNPVKILPVDIAVKSGGETINVACAAAGDDVIIATVGITLGFD